MHMLSSQYNQQINMHKQQAQAHLTQAQAHEQQALLHRQQADLHDKQAMLISQSAQQMNQNSVAMPVYAEHVTERPINKHQQQEKQVAHNNQVSKASLAYNGKVPSDGELAKEIK
ncbi:hypothetical protein JNUCC42_08360 [Brevibacterium sp. JNUCC-42]|uniref:Uncharacterized protein n=1 Tax=Brevibacillus laterosporus TaxID=1465 RepID=A0A502IRE7_BRELA|nr:hypothetical protein EEL30_15990 [Brevibacillus laterosporus]QOT00673.1 hypothetical protein JNUCC42_08360 [Brevibacterium sp. JNUCC-42]RAP30586.1 hypothetical protein C2W64_01782 [Brevibacillus laterosporus]TPG73327.1 hypothetical protein EEL31_02885 [Brevibacillus laterosporus]TPG88158.1 hypothetical protein EEL32_10385 [Brevibacillus laterosporus]